MKVKWNVLVIRSSAKLPLKSMVVIRNESKSSCICIVIDHKLLQNPTCTFLYLPIPMIIMFNNSYFLFFLILPGLNKFNLFLDPFPFVEGVALKATWALLLKAILGVSRLPFFISANKFKLYHTLCCCNCILQSYLIEI